MEKISWYYAKWLSIPPFKNGFLNSKNKIQLKFKEKYKFKTKEEKDIVTKFIRDNLDDIIPFVYIYGVGL